MKNSLIKEFISIYTYIFGLYAEYKAVRMESVGGTFPASHHFTP
ncbi:hypothetical protein [Membranihabitans marinus]|nr:hypothetical protein [Membranihabitans marinus]